MGREIYDIVNDMAEVLNASQMQRLQEVQVFGGEELYPTIQAKGTRLGYGLIKNHCMLDGNKRIGTHVMLVFFALNGIELRYTQKELYEMVLAVADGSLEYEDILLYYIEYSTMPKQAELKINTIGEVSVCFFAFTINCKINIIKSIISPLMSKEIGDSNCCILKTVLKNNIMDVDKIKPITHGLMPFKKA